MPVKPDLNLARRWAAKARSDLLNADNNLAAAQVPHDTVCFHCQQAAEKALEAYLVAAGQRHPITHDLIALLERVLILDPHAECLRDSLALLLPYAIEVRYPDDGPDPTAVDAGEARQAADLVWQWLRRAAPALDPEA